MAAVATVEAEAEAAAAVVEELAWKSHFRSVRMRSLDCAHRAISHQADPTPRLRNARQSVWRRATRMRLTASVIC